MQAILDQNFIAKALINKTETNFGEKVGLIATLFGCWHKDLSRPFTAGREAYRACTSCGARKKFDKETLQTKGSFYYPPSISLPK